LQESPTTERSRFHPAAQLVFHGLRLYRPGDSPRLIHWRTSARLGEPMVREFEDPPENDLTLVVEARRPDHDPQAEAAFERLISLAATICWEWCRQRGDPFLLIVAGATARAVAGLTGPTLARQLLECLAVEPGSASPDTAAATRVLQEQTLPAGPVLVISPVGGTLADSLRPSVRRTVIGLECGAEQEGSLFQL
jgi:uncharacterized protein (DUF58 family)